VERNDLAQAILQATDGLPVAVYRKGNELIPLRVRSMIDGSPGMPSPESTPIWGMGSASVPLGQVADFSDLSWEDSIVRRYDRRRAITVQSDTVGITYDALLARVRPKIEAISLPQGYTLDWAGEYELAVKGDKGVQKYMPLALMMMFFILVALFNGFRQPVIIMLVVPLALVGMVTGLLLTGQAFGFMAMLGAYSLIGMLIKNAVVLIEQIEFSIKEGGDRHQAVIDASVSRLRPVTMASATTILGMLPLLTDPLFASMAVTIMFGLAFASVLTLIVVPMLYTLFFRVKPL
jgi:multidrug efflux pump subunit AcrB